MNGCFGCFKLLKAKVAKLDSCQTGNYCWKYYCAARLLTKHFCMDYAGVNSNFSHVMILMMPKCYAHFVLFWRKSQEYRIFLNRFLDTGFEINHS